MIHKLFFYSRDSNKGLLLFDDKSIDLDHNLLQRLINTLSQLSIEMKVSDQSKGLLKELEIGRHQISLVDYENYYYAIINDGYDNEPFIRNILDLLISRFHEKFLPLQLAEHLPYDDTYELELKEYLNTMNFPSELIPVIEPYVNDFIMNQDFIFTSLYLTDLDNGIVAEWIMEEEGRRITKVLQNILSEIYLEEKNWLAETDIIGDLPRDRLVSHEFWVIQKIQMTDFAILGTGFYLPDRDRKTLLRNIENLAVSIQQEYTQRSFNLN